MNYQRINKVLSSYGICSRRKAEILIKEKKVLVNGMIAELGMKVNLTSDSIKVDGKLVKTKNFHSKVILLNKPKYIITSCSDNQNRKTILDLLPKEYHKGFYPIGRLDYLTRGALLITNNGTLCYKLSHPKFEHEKTYLVKINGNLNERNINIWRTGIKLHGFKTNPCHVEVVEQKENFSSLKIILKEGKNRQIRKIINSFGYKVLDLQRIKFGNISLGNLKEGNWRLIKKDQAEVFK